MTINNSQSTQAQIKSEMSNTIGKAKETVNSISVKGKEVSQEMRDEIKGKLQSIGTSIASIDFAEKLTLYPEKIIDSIRTAEGSNRDEKLLGFQNKIDHMGKGELKFMRDHLVKEMANPKNSDDELLGALLNAVNKEIDSRSSQVFPKPPFPFPNPIEKPVFPPIGIDDITGPGGGIEHPGTCTPKHPFPNPNFENFFPMKNKLD